MYPVCFVYYVSDRAISHGIPLAAVLIDLRWKKTNHNINPRGKTITTTATKQHCLTVLYLKYVRTEKNMRKLKGPMSTSDPFSLMFMCHIFVEMFVGLLVWFSTKNSLCTNFILPRDDKQADFHATLWEATVVKLHVALYIDIMMDEPTFRSFSFCTYLWLSLILYAVLCFPNAILDTFFFFLGIWELKAEHFKLPE